MAFNEIVKNVYSFANILVQAHSEVVGGWDRRSVQNAYNWARYCAKVEQESRQKSYRSELDKHIQSLTVLLDPVSLLHLDLNKLAGASALLTKVLNKNCFFPKTLHPFLDNESRCREKVNVANSKLFYLLADDRIVDESQSIQGQFVLDRLIALYLVCGATHRYDMFVERIIRALAELTGGMDILVCCLMANVTDVSHCDHMPAVKGKLVHWISRKYSCALLHCDQDLVRRACECDDQFLNAYLTGLEVCGDQMAPRYGLSGTGELYHWRNSDSKMELSYRDLYYCLCHLLHRNKRVNTIVTQWLERKSEQSYVNVWCDVFKRIQKDNISSC